MSHVAFCVKDMAKSLAFYQEALGFGCSLTGGRIPPPAASPTSINTGAPRGDR